MIKNITARLFTGTPSATLYHYTSLQGLLGIVRSAELRASDIRYMNDSAELRHTLDLLRNHITARVVAGTDAPTLLNQLLEWLDHRIVGGPLLFGASFRANGNLLSQWRGYSVHGKGVSLGFDPAHLQRCAQHQQFDIGKCLYDSRLQHRLIEQIVDAIEAQAAQQGDNRTPLAVFADMEPDLLRIAAILKHPSFEEEQEWRLVSPPITDCRGHPVSFREGRSMLVPYYAFGLLQAGHNSINLDHVYLGPNSNSELSMKSLALFLQKMHATPRRGISDCQIPYRQR